MLRGISMTTLTYLKLRKSMDIIFKIIWLGRILRLWKPFSRSLLTSHFLSTWCLLHFLPRININLSKKSVYLKTFHLQASFNFWVAEMFYSQIILLGPPKCSKKNDFFFTHQTTRQLVEIACAVVSTKLCVHVWDVFTYTLYDDWQIVRRFAKIVQGLRKTINDRPIMDAQNGQQR